jgi:hypothetical protein
MKKCYRCGETKEFSMFYKNKRKKDGHGDECKTCKVVSDAEYRLKNADKLRETKKLQYEAARVKHKRLPWAEWSELRKKNAVGDQVLKNLNASLRRVNMRKQTLSELDELVIQEAYSLAALRTKTTGFKWSVDHIVPLFHKKACGLNNANNVQVVPASWNSRKGNRNMDEFKASSY